LSLRVQRHLSSSCTVADPSSIPNFRIGKCGQYDTHPFFEGGDKDFLEALPQLLQDQSAKQVWIQAVDEDRVGVLEQLVTEHLSDNIKTICPYILQQLCRML